MLKVNICEFCHKIIGWPNKGFEDNYCHCIEPSLSIPKPKTVLCHGVFDILHAGHLAYFEEAKKYGEKLIVSITADAFVNKGPGRPYFDTRRREKMLRALGIVDNVVVAESNTAIDVIQKIKPDFYVKGPDYRDFSKDVTGEILNEKKAVESYGGQLIFTSGEMFSSSTIINKFFQPRTDDQKTIIEKINELGGYDQISICLDKMNKLKVCVIGEPILDVYRFVRPEGISSKSPSISCRFEYEEKYYGGAWAIEAHLKDFCETTFLDVMHDYPIKTRYIAGTQRVFEVTDIKDSCPSYKIPNGYDAYIVADFGHGMFNGGELEQIKGFIGLNVQTNSSNFGYNIYTKHKRFDYLCLDTREGRLAIHDRSSHPLSIAHEISSDIKRPFGFTCGQNGAYLLYGANNYFSPAFSDVVIDATGAGDAYFAITSLLLASKCNPEFIPFIGCVFAGLKTKIIGNKESVSKSSLLKAIKSILA